MTFFVNYLPISTPIDLLLCSTPSSQRTRAPRYRRKLIISSCVVHQKPRIVRSIVVGNRFWVAPNFNLIIGRHHLLPNSQRSGKWLDYCVTWVSAITSITWGLARDATDPSVISRPCPTSWGGLRGALVQVASLPVQSVLFAFFQH